MNIVLIGMRGSGKSYYGKAIARLLGWKYIDTDAIIEQKENKKISNMISEKGWPYFRKLEKDICKIVAGFDEHVIATGGGMPIEKENIEFLKQNGKIVLLYRTQEQCAKLKLQGKRAKDRPPLTNRNINENPRELIEELKEIWQEREKKYIKSADIIIDVNNEVNPSEIIEKIENC